LFPHSICFQPREALLLSGLALFLFHQGEEVVSIARACDMMLERLVSKRRDGPCQAGPSRDWVKVKNPKLPAMNRAKDAF
jgi:hypothetical protein